MENDHKYDKNDADTDNKTNIHKESYKTQKIPHPFGLSSWDLKVCL